MENFLQWLSSLGEPNWDLILKFADVLAWPLVTLMALLIVRPGRIIDALLENGGELSAAGAAIRLPKRIDQIADALRDDPDAQLEAQDPEPLPPADAEDAYSTVMAGWSRISDKIEEALGERVNKRAPMAAVRELRRSDKIGNKLQRQLEEMWSVRNQVRHAGRKGADRIGVTQARADEYFEAAERLVRSIARAMAYREKKANGVGAQGELKLVPRSGSGADGQILH